jgi:hypothetical protein
MRTGVPECPEITFVIVDEQAKGERGVPAEAEFPDLLVAYITCQTKVYPRGRGVALFIPLFHLFICILFSGSNCPIKNRCQPIVNFVVEDKKCFGVDNEKN